MTFYYGNNDMELLNMTRLCYPHMYEKQAMMGIFTCPTSISYLKATNANVTNRYGYLNAFKPSLEPAGHNSNQFKEVRYGKN